MKKTMTLAPETETKKRKKKKAEPQKRHGDSQWTWQTQCTNIHLVFLVNKKTHADKFTVSHLSFSLSLSLPFPPLPPMNVSKREWLKWIWHLAYDILSL